jgi:hypothetical protein
MGVQTAVYVHNVIQIMSLILDSAMTAEHPILIASPAAASRLAVPAKAVII